MRRLVLDLQDLPLEVILKLSAFAEYDNETGEVIFHPTEDQAREILDIVKNSQDDTQTEEAPDA